MFKNKRKKKRKTFGRPKTKTLNFVDDQDDLNFHQHENTIIIVTDEEIGGWRLKKRTNLSCCYNGSLPLLSSYIPVFTQLWSLALPINNESLTPLPYNYQPSSRALHLLPSSPLPFPCIPSFFYFLCRRSKQKWDFLLLYLPIWIVISGSGGARNSCMGMELSRGHLSTLRLKDDPCRPWSSTYSIAMQKLALNSIFGKPKLVVSSKYGKLVING